SSQKPPQSPQSTKLPESFQSISSKIFQCQSKLRHLPTQNEGFSNNWMKTCRFSATGGLDGKKLSLRSATGTQVSNSHAVSIGGNWSISP
ncbi:MAG: hypothetical protein ACKOFW_13780, partial [Planctomycetaceae bacterium]